MKLKAVSSTCDLGRVLSIMLTFPFPSDFSDPHRTVLQVDYICGLVPVSAA